MSRIIVQKYGGTSVGSTERIRKVAERVVQNKRAGNKLITIVSAMGDTTDHLIQMANELNSNPSSREMDVLLSTGEQVTISLLAMAIESLGEKVVSLTGAQCGIITDSHHNKARIESIDTSRLESELNDDKIIIVAGFQGISDENNITTLGRGGSDTTAVAIAAAVNADLCEIYTDVDGIYTADPRKVEKASFIPEISYDEMLELAKLGAQVLHPRSVELARKYKMPLVLRSSFSEAEGTKIVEVDKLEKVDVRGVTVDNSIARISVTKVPDQPGIAFKLFSMLAEENICIDMILQNLNHDKFNDISFTVNEDDLQQSRAIAERFNQKVGGGGILSKANVSKLSIVGTGITGSADIASKLFGTLSDLGINIEMISTSEIKISCLIEADDCLEAINRIHTVFNLDNDLN